MRTVAASPAPGPFLLVHDLERWRKELDGEPAWQATRRVRSARNKLLGILLAAAQRSIKSTPSPGAPQGRSFPTGSPASHIYGLSSMIENATQEWICADGANRFTGAGYSAEVVVLSRESGQPPAHVTTTKDIDTLNTEFADLFYDLLVPLHLARGPISNSIYRTFLPRGTPTSISRPIHENVFKNNGDKAINIGYESLLWTRGALAELEGSPDPWHTLAARLALLADSDEPSPIENPVSLWYAVRVLKHLRALGKRYDIDIRIVDQLITNLVIACPRVESLAPDWEPIGLIAEGRVGGGDADSHTVPLEDGFDGEGTNALILHAAPSALPTVGGFIRRSENSRLTEAVATHSREKLIHLALSMLRETLPPNDEFDAKEHQAAIACLQDLMEDHSAPPSAQVWDTIRPALADAATALDNTDWVNDTIAGLPTHPRRDLAAAVLAAALTSYRPSQQRWSDFIETQVRLLTDDASPTLVEQTRQLVVSALWDTPQRGEVPNYGSHRTPGPKRRI